VSRLPLPQRFGPLLDPGSGVNRSLLFDKGMDRYDQQWKIVEEGKSDFLSTFTGAFEGHAPRKHFEEFLGRRATALEKLGAKSFRHTTRTRLAIGLGLPSPIETGFLFDRLTGCPYLPGSSVKGMLRAAARLVMDGEIELGADAREFWTGNLDRIFGPEIVPGATPRTGAAIVYDAFPAAWPTLEVDILTPHHRDYYGDQSGAVLPADWDKPVPIPFLTIRAGTDFHFFFKARESDLAYLERLLPIALDELGIGAKKSSGYGTFGEHQAEAPEAASLAPEPPGNDEVPKPARPSAQTKPVVSWSDVELSFQQGSVVAWRGKQTAACSRNDVEKELIQELVKHRRLRAEVEVVKLSEGGYRLVRVQTWKRTS
jgi:CRISPR-associated protein Cmr6